MQYKHLPEEAEEAEMLKKEPHCVNLSVFLQMNYFCGNKCLNVSFMYTTRDEYRAKNVHLSNSSYKYG